MENTCSVILAAGDGKRMKSADPKVLCPVLFKPMIAWVADSVRKAGIGSGCVVLGERADLVEGVLPGGFETVLQLERRGTGHAAGMAADFIRRGSFAHVAILNGDAPFISPEDLKTSYVHHIAEENGVTVLSSQVENPTGYGRIVRDDKGVRAIVEQADADGEIQKINEINSGVFWVESGFLLQFFDNMTCDNKQGEYYLTDIIGYAVQTGQKAGACVVGADAVLGANDRKGLAALNQLAMEKVLDRHYSAGVHIPFPDGIIIGPDVTIGPDTTILPGTVLKGNTVIGSRCEIGPNSWLENAVIGDGCRVASTCIEASTLEDGVKIGPMSNVRPNCHIEKNAKIGDFVEIKNSTIGEATSVAHLTYVGDSDVGARCNFGCGVVTVNYDGSKKHRTIIGDDAFIGCNTNLVAPVRLGDRAYSAAGTTVTGDVPDGALVIGRVRQTVKEHWADENAKYKRKK